MYVAVLTSPLQIFNFIEYLNSFARPCGLIEWTVILPIEQNYSKGLGTVGDFLRAEAGCKIHFFIGLPGKKVGFNKIVKRILFARTYKRTIDDILGDHKLVENLVIGDYRSRECRHLIACCSRANVTLLDDGSATHQIAKYLDSPKSFSLSPMFPRMDIHGLILRFSGVSLSDKANKVMFTHYLSSEEESIAVIPHNYTYWRSQLKLRNHAYSKDILFLGLSHVETGITTKASYIDSLKRILDFYRGGRILYKPHRKESINKLNDISALGYKVLDVEIMPVEYKLLHGKELPMEVASIASSALDNLPILFGRKLTCRCFVPQQSYCTRKMRAHFSDILSYHQQTSSQLGLNISYLDSRADI